MLIDVFNKYILIVPHYVFPTSFHLFHNKAHLYPEIVLIIRTKLMTEGPNHMAAPKTTFTFCPPDRIPILTLWMVRRKQANELTIENKRKRHWQNYRTFRLLGEKGTNNYIYWKSPTLGLSIPINDWTHSLGATHLFVSAFIGCER